MNDYTELYESWINGNKNYVARQVKDDMYGFTVFLQESVDLELITTKEAFDCLCSVVRLNN